MVLVVGGLLLATRLEKSLSPSGNTPSRPSWYPSNYPSLSYTFPSPVVTVPPLPTPGPGRTTYTNTQFGYSIQYPTDWPLKVMSADGSFVSVFKVLDPAYPEAGAFDIECANNPNQLDAENYWKQNKGSDQMGIGSITFSSGAPAFVALGHGEKNLYLYTIVHNATACQIIAPVTDPANTKVIFSSINTFQWQ